MAENRDSLAEILCCSVCLEDYEEDGDHIPRLLPCTHTLCEACIKHLIKDNKLECPECRKQHKASNGEKSFSQNKYLLVQVLRRKMIQRKKKDGTMEVVKSMERNLFSSAWR